MAPGCEPSLVKKMMDVIRPHAYGQSMAGAGGGGFMYVITKEPNMSEFLESLIKQLPECHEVTFHDIMIDTNGLLIEEVDADS